MAPTSFKRAPGMGLWLGLALLVLMVDQLTKTLVIGAFQLGDSRTLTSYFNLVRAHNSGAAFNFLANASGWHRWFFVGLGTLASGFMVWMLRAHPGQRLFCFAISMVLGGAVQYASRADSHIVRQKQIHRLRHVIRELTKQLPADKQADSEVKELAAFGCGTTMHVAHLVAPRLDGEDHTKDIDFTAAGVRARREAGYTDTLRMIERSPWRAPTDPIEGVIEHR